MSGLSISVPAVEAPDPSTVQEGIEGTENQASAPAGATEAAVNKAAAPADKEGDRPEWLPEKFKSPEDLAKAYRELETKLSRGEHKETPKGEEAPKPAEGANKANLSRAFEEFARDGKVSEETYKALETAGVSRQDADVYVAGQAAQTQQKIAKVAEAVGGTERLSEVLEWAKTGLSKEEIAAYNAVQATGDVAAISLALSGIAAKMDASEGSNPSLIRGEGVPTKSGVKPFESRQEIIAAMADPRYKNDAAYQKKVADRMALTELSAFGR